MCPDIDEAAAKLNEIIKEVNATLPSSKTIRRLRIRDKEFEKTTSKKNNSKKVSSRTKKVATNIMEYYDLPNTYNQTTVKLLFQTPKKLFVYWEISEDDKKKYFEENGNDFFETTTPFLVVKNKTKNYSFEIQINDFANSWYFNINDENYNTLKLNLYLTNIIFSYILIMYTYILWRLLWKR